MSLERIFETCRVYLNTAFSGPYQGVLVDVTVIAGIAVVAAVTYMLTRMVLWGVESVVNRSSTTWDDHLLTPHLMAGVSQLAPALSVSYLLPAFFVDNTGMHHWLKLLTSFYILWAVVRIVTIFIDNVYMALARRDELKMYAVKGIFQMLKLVAIGVGVISALSLLAGKTPLAILTAIGASAAVLMLVFKDTILGLVASVQLTANQMLHKGDWIVAPKHDANGEVIDVSLTTVKVRNWDNSVSTIPPYSLISDSFRNYEAMLRSGGRRVERAINIDLGSVRFCSADELARLRERGFLDGMGVDESARVINVQLFRRYLERYLMGDARVNSDMTCMVRQLEPTQWGLPVQLYFFTRTTVWKEFEHVQADVMDYVYALVNEFGLRVYQAPAGEDFRVRN